MRDDSSTETGAASGRRCRARIKTAHGDPETAQLLARALSPDNTAEMETHTEGTSVVTTIERETPGGLASNADDYLVNLRTGTRLLPGDGQSTGQNQNIDTDRATTNRDTSDTPSGGGDADNRQ